MYFLKNRRIFFKFVLTIVLSVNFCSESGCCGKLYLLIKDADNNLDNIISRPYRNAQSKELITRILSNATESVSIYQNYDNYT